MCWMIKRWRRYCWTWRNNNKDDDVPKPKRLMICLRVRWGISLNEWFMWGRQFMSAKQSGTWVRMNALWERERWWVCVKTFSRTDNLWERNMSEEKTLAVTSDFTGLWTSAVGTMKRMLQCLGGVIRMNEPLIKMWAVLSDDMQMTDSALQLAGGTPREKRWSEWKDDYTTRLLNWPRCKRRRNWWLRGY